jgi:hypothetical protein
VNNEPKQRILGRLLIALGVIVALVVFFGLRLIHADALWFLTSRWGPDGLWRQQSNSYDQLYQWATHATHKGIFAEQFCGYFCAVLLVILGIVCRAWARDKEALSSRNNLNDRNA